MLNDRLPFDVVPAVRAHIKSDGLHDEVRLVGTPTPAIELEVELATQHDWARVVDHVSGFLVHLSKRSVLERLGRIESTSWKEPPDASLGASRISATEQQHRALAVEYHDLRGTATLIDAVTHSANVVNSMPLSLPERHPSGVAHLQ